MSKMSKKVDSASKNGPNLMYDGLLEAYGQVVWLPGISTPPILPCPGGKNTPKTCTYNYIIPSLSAAISHWTCWA